MSDTLQQRLAASCLIVTCEKICTNGYLPADQEQALRVLIIKACKAFEIAPLAERGSVVPFPGNDTGGLIQHERTGQNAERR